MVTSRIVKVLRANTGARDLRNVFEDFCAMAATAIRNRVDHSGYQAREDEYERIRSHYTPAQMDRFAEALAFVALVGSRWRWRRMPGFQRIWRWFRA